MEFSNFSNFLFFYKIPRGSRLKREHANLPQNKCKNLLETSMLLLYHLDMSEVSIWDIIHLQCASIIQVRGTHV